MSTDTATDISGGKVRNDPALAKRIAKREQMLDILTMMVDSSPLKHADYGPYVFLSDIYALLQARGYFTTTYPTNELNRVIRDTHLQIVQIKGMKNRRQLINTCNIPPFAR